MIRRIKLMTDYICYPLWGMDYPDIGEIYPRGLPLRRETILRLDHWADVYDSLLETGLEFKTKAEEEDWIQEGVLLWKLLQQELGPEYKVYLHILELTSTPLASPEELDRLFPKKYTKTESPYSSAQFEERILKVVSPITGTTLDYFGADGRQAADE